MDFPLETCTSALAEITITSRSTPLVAGDGKRERRVSTRMGMHPSRKEGSLRHHRGLRPSKGSSNLFASLALANRRGASGFEILVQRSRLRAPGFDKAKGIVLGFFSTARLRFGDIERRTSWKFSGRVGSRRKHTSSECQSEHRKVERRESCRAKLSYACGLPKNFLFILICFYSLLIRLLDKDTHDPRGPEPSSQLVPLKHHALNSPL